MKIRTLFAAAAWLTAGAAHAQTPPNLPPFAGGPATTQQAAPMASASTATATPAPAAQPATMPKQAAIADTATFSLEKPVLVTAPGTTLARPDSLLSNPALKDLPVAKVRVKGTTEARPTAGGAAVSMTWTAVTLDDGSKSVSLPKPLQTRLVSPSPLIPQAQQFKAKGDIDTVVEAIKQLLSDSQQTAQTETAKTTEKKTSSSVTNTAASPARSIPQGGSDTGNQSLGAGNYQPWQLPQSQTSTSTDPQTVTSIEQCPAPRIDLANMQVWPQTRTVTTTNGAATKGNCQDGNFPIPLQWDYAGCKGSNIVDVSNMVYRVYRKATYVADNGQPVDASSCQESATEAIALNWDVAACPTKIDVPNKVATDQAELVFTDKGVRNVVQTCSTFPNAPTYTITETPNGCTIRNDFTAQTSYKQTRLIFSKNNVEQQVSGCADSATTYKMVPDTSFCQPITDTAKKKYYTTAAYRIDTDQGSQYISTCAPTDTGADIKEITTGCETMHTDDFTAGVSYLFSKWILTSTNKPVTDCAQTTASATHQYMAQGWQNDDSLKQATQMLAVYVKLNDPVGLTMIDAPQVRSQSITSPYTLQGTTDVPNGVYHDTGCMRSQDTDRVQQWKRPDGSTYNYKIGTGTPTAAIDVCQQISQYRTVVKYQCYDLGSDGVGKQTWAWNQGRTKKSNPSNNYASFTNWGTITSSDSGVVGNGFTFCPTTITCTATSGGTQAELCAAGTY